MIHICLHKCWYTIESKRYKEYYDLTINLDPTHLPKEILNKNITLHITFIIININFNSFQEIHVIVSNEIMCILYSPKLQLKLYVYISLIYQGKCAFDRWYMFPQKASV